MTDTKNTAPAGIDLDKIQRYSVGVERCTMDPDNYEGEWVKLEDVRALARRAAADAPAADEHEAEISRELLEVARGTDDEYLRGLLERAASEATRFYGGMMAWKKTAQKKDADWNAERMGRIDDRCAARAAHPIGQVSPAIDQGAATDAQQLAELILADPDGGYMRISSALEYCDDGAMRFTVTNPETGRRFGVHLGLAELRDDEPSATPPAPVCHAPAVDLQRIRNKVDWENGLTQLLEDYKHATDYGINSREAVQKNIIAYVLDGRAAVSPVDEKQAEAFRLKMVATEAETLGMTPIQAAQHFAAKGAAVSPSDATGKAVTLPLELAQRCLSSMKQAVTFGETGKGRPPSQTCLFEIEELEAILKDQTNIDATGKADDASAGELKDHEIRETVNKLRDIALKYHAAGQLRAQIADVIVPILKRATSAADAMDAGEVPEYTMAIGIAGDRYYYGFENAHPLPAEWSWNALWDVMRAAAMGAGDQGRAAMAASRNGGAS
jgi:hypothetical protein